MRIHARENGRMFKHFLGETKQDFWGEPVEKEWQGKRGVFRN